jgi:RNA polymerase sigma factor (sigma-70 family)
MSLIAAGADLGDFEWFYAANFGDTVAMAYTYTADLGDAQDIAQEAFTRAWRLWTRVSTYDNPVAWVRRVAVNLARSRWRRLRVGAAHLVRQHIAQDVPEINPDHVAVVAALRKLPHKQREAIVLHHMMDVPVSEVAEHFEGAGGDRQFVAAPRPQRPRRGPPARLALGDQNSACAAGCSTSGGTGQGRRRLGSGARDHRCCFRRG